ncbi:hypothetical protein [Kutzneria sp. CA-103260]|uniref:hypothetical protein n=1 Tax=Kutzneria sp. CA-103260 TaxID=2802641 RepID=UPI001BABFDFA|nr:hypothetical protein [Kutzneria sp. CA-103260]QUQ62405.1 hypothetical protein JJ691_01170 [Kutzneria sp. CA-103260]
MTLLVAGVLAVGSTFANLYIFIVHTSLSGGSPSRVFATTGWVSSYPSAAGTFPTAVLSRSNYYGVPVVVAGLLALFAANTLLRSRVVVEPQLLRTRLAAVAMTGLIVGFAWLVVASFTDEIEQYSGNQFVEITAGTGIWILAAAAIVGTLGCVLLFGVHADLEPDEPEVLVYEMEMDTPPIGFPALVELAPVTDRAERWPR